MMILQISERNFNFWKEFVRFHLELRDIGWKKEIPIFLAGFRYPV
jgi:hypothetical protein